MLVAEAINGLLLLMFLHVHAMGDGEGSAPSTTPAMSLGSAGLGEKGRGVRTESFFSARHTQLVPLLQVEHKKS